MSARIFRYRHTPNLLLLKPPRNSHAPFPTALLHNRRAPYRFSSLSHNHPSKFLQGPNFPPSGAAEDSFRSWNFASATDSRNGIGAADEGIEVAVVLLGWLGAKPRHLQRYARWYNEKGIHAVTHVASVTDVLSFDLGRSLEERIRKLTDELAAWLSDAPRRNRFFVFHTFSNTGWLTYGAILSHLRDRQDLLDRVKGCIVDSGGDPVLDPKVWAAGFTTALLKKSSAATSPSPEAGGAQLESGDSSWKIEKKEPLLIETLLLFAFEKLFSYLLNLPEANQKLAKIVSVLSEDQPPCPQLYLYSSGDKVIPFERVESFIEEQRRSGRQVWSYNFGSSPHVDHYRTFPDLYTSQLHNFLKECLIMVGKF